MITRKITEKIPITVFNKDYILENISKEENGELKYKEKETIFEYINRPMTLVELYKRKIFFGFFRMIFAISITICIIYYKNNSNFQKHEILGLPILLFSTTFLFILSNLIYFSHIIKIYKSFNINISHINCLLKEISRAISYFSLPIMFYLILFKYKDYIYLPYLFFIIFGFLSTTFDEINIFSFMFLLKVILLLALNIIYLFFYNILKINFLINYKEIINIIVGFFILFISSVLISQSKFIKPIITNNTSSFFFLRIFEGLFFANIFIFLFNNNVYNYIWFKWIAFSYNILMGVICFFIPFMFSSLQLNVIDIQKITVRNNLIDIFSIHNHFNIEFKSFKQYYNDLIGKLKTTSTKNLEGMVYYLNNIGGNSSGTFIDSIEDLSKLNCNSNITFDGFFNYSPIRMELPLKEQEWRNIIREETNLNMKLERFRNLIIMEYLIRQVKPEYIIFDISIPIKIYLNEDNITYLIKDKQNNETENIEQSNDNKSFNSLHLSKNNQEQKLFSNLLPEDSDSMILSNRYDMDSSDLQTDLKLKIKREIASPVVVFSESENNIGSMSNILNEMDIKENNPNNDLSSNLIYDPNSSLNDDKNILKETKQDNNTVPVTDNNTVPVTDNNTVPITDDDQIKAAALKKSQRRKRRVTIIDPSITLIAKQQTEKDINKKE